MVQLVSIGRLMGPRGGGGTPSWVLSGASLDLYFAQGRYWDGATEPIGTVATASRALAAYAQDSTGAFVNFAVNTARITNLGLLVENAATQLVQENTNANAATWSRSNVTVTTGQASPDGGTTAMLLNEGTNTGAHSIFPASVAFTSGTTYTFSAIVKPGTRSRVQLSPAATAFTSSANYYVNYFLSGSGSVTAQGSGIATSGITAIGSTGWYYCWFTAQANASASGAAILVAMINGATSTRALGYTGTSLTLTVWCPQVEAGSFVTSPIINTTTGSLTRPADNITITGTAAKAAVYAAKSAYSDTNSCTFSTTNVVCNINAALLQASANTKMMTSNGTDTAEATIGSAGTIAGVVTTSYGFDGTNLTAVANGGTPATTAAAWGATSGTITVGNRAALDQALCGYLRRFAFSASASNFNDASLDAIPNNQVFQRAEGTTSGNVPLSGSYSLTSAVEAKVVNATTGAIVVDWTTVDASPAAGAWSGTISVPQGGPYKAKVRGANGRESALSNPFTVGALILLIGQSNMARMWSVRTSPPASNSLTWRNAGGGWWAPNLVAQAGEPNTNQGLAGFGGGGSVELANRIQSLLGIPVGILCYAISATDIASWQSAGSSWTNMTGYLTSENITDFECVVWYQGEGDASHGTSGATYKTDLANVESQCLTLCGRTALPFGVVTISSPAAYTAANIETIRQAQLQYIDTNTSGSVYYAYNATALYNATQDPHFDETQYETFADWGCLSVAKALGIAVTNGAGPHLTTAVGANNSAVITLTVVQNGGTGLTDANGSTSGVGITGFTVTKNGSAATISSTAFSGNTILLTLSAALATGNTVTVNYLYGHPDVTNPVYDNNTVSGQSLGRPLQPSRGGITVTGL